MATDVVIPQLGESISEAVIASWLKPDGAYVERDEEIVELETDKVTMPLPSPVAGVIKHDASEGDTVIVGASIASIDESAEKPAGAAPAAEAEAPAPAAAAPPPAQPAPAATQTTPAPASAPAGDADVRSTPLARKIAEEKHVDLAGISGTGPGGRIREQDVLAYIQAGSNGSARPGPAAAPAAERGVRRERMSQLRQRIAVRLVEAQQTAAMLTTFNECDMTAVMQLRSRHKEQFEKSHGVRLGFMSFFIKAACSALERYPAVNAFITQGDSAPEVEYHDYCDVAVAVGTDKGLVVPVLRNAQARSFAEIESGIGELAAKARDGKLALEDMQGGTFTISNGGVYGSMMSTPILNPPQSGILGMHNIIRRPIEHPDKPGSGEVVVRPMMYLALSYDHRIVDGEGAVRFLRHIKECIEDPERLLLDV
ncbi:MAG: 2-oxoglutarate dehydrogenase complex dihydrolipoyllysine-residue succinyltransferase [Planctomycetota bacterium]